MNGAPRIAIAGGPRTGKSTLSARLERSLGLQAQHTDDLVGVLEWSECSEEAARWMAEPGPWIIEGTAVIRALRKALKASPERPCDVLLVLTEPKVPTTRGQDAMAKGVATVLSGIIDELRARGVDVVVAREVREGEHATG